MEQIRKFLQGKGFALVLAACLLAAAAAGVWAVQTVRGELQKNLDGLRDPASSARTAPGIDEGLDLTTPDEEDSTEWQQPTAPAANSVANVPKASSSTAPSGGAGGSSGASSGSAGVREPSALQTESAPASSSAAPASTRPVSGRILNAYSGDELVYNKTLGDWRTHNGIDYAAAKGEKVSAPAAGKVTLAGADGSWGPTVAIEDASGRLWRISGVADLKVKAGDTVTAGQALGTVGSVSCECAEDSHIHLETGRKIPRPGQGDAVKQNTALRRENARRGAFLRGAAEMPPAFPVISVAGHIAFGGRFWYDTIEISGFVGGIAGWQMCW